MTAVIDDFVISRLFPKDQKVYKWSWKIPVIMSEPEIITFSTSAFPSLLTASGVTAGYFYTRHPVLNNLFGAAFSLQGIAQMSLGSYMTGVILLCGLFVYDVFWVFGTDVMVTVAKSFQAPIKLVFPRGWDEPKEKQFSMLGLGDIVIPGLFVALMLRWDIIQCAEKGQRVSEGKKIYFYSQMTAYVLGLGTTVVMMIQFKAAQPALLYLVPAALLSALFTSAIRGQISQLLAYSEEEAEDGADKDDKKSK